MEQRREAVEAAPSSGDIGRGRPGAADLLAVLTERSLIEIRRMAETGELYVEDEVLDPHVPADVDALARVHLLADVTHGFANVLRASAFRRGRAARHALRWRWSATSESGRRWMRSRLALHGPRHVAALTQLVGPGADASGSAGADGRRGDTRRGREETPPAEPPGRSRGRHDGSS